MTRFMALLLVPLLGCRRARSEAPAAVAIRARCVPAERHEFADARHVLGTVAAAPDHGAIVSGQVAGRLVRVAVREGDRVARNAVIAEVEARPLQDALRLAEAQLAQARAARDVAGTTATREAHLYERGISARQARDSAQASLLQARAAVSGATAQVDAARQNVERARIRSPLAGVVVRLVRRAGEVVDGTPATPVAEIADTSSLELAASASPADLVLLREGQRATVTFGALPGRAFEGSVRAVSPSIDPSTGVGSVRLALAAAAVQPPLGLLGRAAVVIGEARPALVVPAAALRNAGGARVEVVVCEGGRAHVREVAVGQRRDGGVEITRGLEPGARVATEEVAGIEDGAALTEGP